MPYVILGLLLTGPLSLYDLRKRFGAGISLFYSASFGALQRALRQLVEQGDVTVADAAGAGRPKKLYTVTPAGRERWRAWMREPIAPGADAETTLLAKVYLLGRLDDPGDRRFVLDRVRERAASAMDDLTGLATQVDAAAAAVPDDSRLAFEYQRATLDYGLRAHALMLAWTEELRGQAS
ncbi:PadR family transcriptional regulator [uncultured Microbacterium sp.]|uniref:Uncharacterized protein n=1 Tax=uncultured Microbacterium sp. TaxID=191216 RepID=A0A1Y5PFH1_9MICO|nr:helix-turn-helix transcriptional regulator [uncultured Microbacterium sp.]SBS74891.1 conserved hypothetical protein [uncultured Microbacterium sp.]